MAVMSLNILLKRSSTPSKRPVAASMQYGELDLNYDAATGGVYYKDTNNNVVKVGPAQVGSTAPNATPAGSAGNSAGEFWYDTSTSTLKIFNGTAWVATAGSGSVVSVTGTAPIQVDNTDPTSPVISVTAATTGGCEGVVQLSSATNSTCTAGWAATPSAVKSAYDLANAALPLAGGTMTGGITLAAAGVTFSNASQLTAISNSTSTTSSTTAASSTAVKSAYDLANAALPLSGGTLTGALTVAAAGINFSDASNVTAISDSTSTVSSVIAASSTAVKTAYDLAAGALSSGGGTMSGVIVFDAGQTFSVTGIQNATLVQKGVVQVGTNIDVAAGVISVADGTTSAKGVVQLYDATDSSSTTLALTAAQGKNLQDQINALAVTSNLTLAGTFDASTGLVDSITVAGGLAGFAVGSALPSPSSGNADYFVIVDVQGSTGPSGAPPYHIGDWFLSSGTAWDFLNVGYQPGAATTSNAGIVYLATDAEVQAGADTSNKAVNPASLQSKVSDSTSTTSSTTIASSTAVKSAYDLANAALPKSGGTMTGTITFAAGQTFPVTDIQDATTSQKGVVQIGTNISVAAGVISVANASTSAKGVVQLVNAYNSSSTTTAPTSAALQAVVQLMATSYVNKAGGTMDTDALLTFRASTPFGTPASTGIVFWDDSQIGGITSNLSYIAPTQPTPSTAYNGNVAASIAAVQELQTLVVPESVATAKGDILVGTAAGVVGVQSVGTNGQLLVADSTATSGLAYTSTVDGGTY